MTKCLKLFLFAIVAIACAACSNDSALKMQIESGKKVCPINLGMAGKLTSMDYDSKEKQVEFLFTVNKQIMDVEDIKKDASIAKESMKLALSKGDLNKLLGMMVDADASLKVVYKNKGSNDDFSIVIPAEELKAIYENPMSEEDSDRMLLQNSIKQEQHRLPTTIERGLKVVDVKDNGKNLVYTCEVDENLYEIITMEESKDELKSNMRSMLKDRSMRQQAKILSKLNKGFVYEYVGNPSGKKVVIEFTPEELGEIVGKKK